MNAETPNQLPVVAEGISSWDDVVFIPAQFVQEMRDLADHYEGKKKLTLRSYTVTASGEIR